jgi:hypothetical protein
MGQKTTSIHRIASSNSSRINNHGTFQANIPELCYFGGIVQEGTTPAELNNYGTFLSAAAWWSVSFPQAWTQPQAPRRASASQNARARGSSSSSNVAGEIKLWPANPMVEL